MSRRRVNPFKTSAKARKRTKDFMDIAVGNPMKAAGKAASKAHKVQVRNKKARQAQIKSRLHGTFIGRMPLLALLVRLWVGHGCLMKLVLIPCFFFYLALLPVDLVIAVIASIFAK